MAIKKYKPVTPSSRTLTVLMNEDLSENSPLKSLTKGKKRRSGRMQGGRLTSRHLGGGHKKKYR